MSHGLIRLRSSPQIAFIRKHAVDWFVVIPENFMALTPDESAFQKEAALAVLELLAGHGVATFQQVQENLPNFDETNLLRGIALASSKGGLSISINKRMFGLTANFSVVDVPERTVAVIAILRREIQFAQENESVGSSRMPAEAGDSQSAASGKHSTDIVTMLCPFSIRLQSKAEAPDKA